MGGGERGKVVRKKQEGRGRRSKERVDNGH